MPNSDGAPPDSSAALLYVIARPVNNINQRRSPARQNALCEFMTMAVSSSMPTPMQRRVLADGGEQPSHASPLGKMLFDDQSWGPNPA
jgi:hypothetical protein